LHGLYGSNKTLFIFEDLAKIFKPSQLLFNPFKLLLAPISLPVHISHLTLGLLPKQLWPG
jgi:hypothetical protein